MLKVKASVYQLYSHLMKGEYELELDVLRDIIEEGKYGSFEDLLMDIETDFIENYISGSLDMEGDTGNGSYYPGNDGHDNLRIALEYPPELEEQLKDYFVIPS